MYILKDITKKSGDVISVVNMHGLYKKIKIYQLNNCEIFYCITHKNKLHISGSGNYGAPQLDIMLYAFKQLTNKNISDFEISSSNRTLYIIEKNSY
ncbi:hypothetical protein CF065_18975 [Clostridium sporogenes]